MVNQSLNNSSSLHNCLAARDAHSNPMLKPSKSQLTQEMEESLKAIQGLGLTIEVRGSWVFGANSSHQDKFQATGFKWSYRRSVKESVWYLPPSNLKRNSYRRTLAMEKIREKYGNQAV